MATTQITAAPGGQQILISREFAAPRDLLFRAHTDPELLLQWLGPRSMTMTVDLNEVRDGGRWRYTHRDPNGNEARFHGVFHGDPSPEGIVRTFEYDGVPGHVALETLTFEERAGSTTVHVNAVYQSVEDRDGMVQSGMEEGLNDSYERLGELLSRLRR
jgi:uncharacterized protein YndB with AHSA1/START domain